MQKIESFRKGRIWLNVFKTPEGELAVTVKKSFRADGNWKTTPFFRPEYRDIDNLKCLLDQFVEAREGLEQYGGDAQ